MRLSSTTSTDVVDLLLVCTTPFDTMLPLSYGDDTTTLLSVGLHKIKKLILVPTDFVDSTVMSP